MSRWDSTDVGDMGILWICMILWSGCCSYSAWGHSLNPTPYLLLTLILPLISFIIYIILHYGSNNKIKGDIITLLSLCNILRGAQSVEIPLIKRFAKAIRTRFYLTMAYYLMIEIYVKYILMYYA